MSYKINMIKKYIHSRFVEGKAAILRNGVRAYWWSEVVNFGDLITPFLLQKYGYTPIQSELKNANLVSTGSILQQVDDDYAGVVLGSGLIQPIRRSLVKATILSVRGPLTRDLLGQSKTLPLGDPGLLLSHFIRSSRIEYEFGLVPHYKDLNNPNVLKILSHFGRDILLIDVRRDPEKVSNDIAKCNVILSSSLHGLIVAHSFGHAAQWLEFSDKVQGQGFKFRDYFQSLNFDQDPLIIKDSMDYRAIGKVEKMPSKDLIHQRQSELEKLYKMI